MRFLVSVVFLFSLLASGLRISSPTLAAECSFVLGFKTLHDLVPDVAGDCVVDQRYNPQNGDSLQETTRGLLVWRKADNFTAFTDGYRTWVNGPFGVEQRLNTERFQWEAIQQLRNAEYVLPLVDPLDGREKETRIRLVDGEYTLSSDSPPQRVRAGLLSEFVATGDLNDDAIPDAVAPLFLNTGGSGTFIYMTAMVDRGGALVQAGREFLGDRIKLNRIAVAGDGTTTVDMVVHGPNDPMCCPTQRTVKKFQAADLVATVGPATIEAGHVSIDTQGLFSSWRASVVRASPYDVRQPPGPKGLPKHIEVSFGEVDPRHRDAFDPVMYIIPVTSYQQLWDEQGKRAVANVLDRIDLLVRGLPSPPPTSGLPALPYEEIGGVNDLAVQVGRANVTEKSASRNGFRYVGRFVQDPNPVSKERLRYIYAGFTNDGQYLVAFFYPVTTAVLPAIQDVPAVEFDRVATDHKAYMLEKAEMLNKLSSSDWQPDLAKLDALVGSLEIKGMPSSGIIGAVWQWERTANQGLETPVANPEVYTLTFRQDGTLAIRADCNTGGGPYNIAGPRSGMAGGLRVGRLVTTLAECGPGSRHTDMMNILAAVQDYDLRQAGQVLALKWPAAGPVELFRKVPATGASPVATAIQLPEGVVCQFAGRGATLAFEGKRVNYTCSQSDNETTVLLNNPVFRDGAWLVERGLIQRTADGFALKSSQIITMDIARIELVDGMVCFNAGKGATLAFEGKRLNYTCGQPDVALVGNIHADDPLWTAERVLLERKPDRWAVASSEVVKIEAVTGEAVSKN